MKAAIAAALVAGGLVATPHAGAVDVQPFVKGDRFNTLQISPNGEYLAAVVPNGDRTGLVILRRADMKKTAALELGKDNHVHGIQWISPERVLLSAAQKFGDLDQPQPTGELFAVNADGKRAENLVGYRVEGRGTGTRIQPKEVEAVYAELVDGLPGNDGEIIVAITPFNGDPYSRAERMDVMTGRRKTIAKAPVHFGSFTTDSKGTVRFAVGAKSDNASKLYYRENDEAEWRLINDELETWRVETPIGFAADDRTAYLQVEHKEGPDSIVAMDMSTGERRDVLRDDDTDPAGIIYRNNSGIPIGAWILDGKPRAVYFDKDAPEARLHRSLEGAFGGDHVVVTSQTTDGRLALVHVSSDRNPGDFYLFDTVAKKADLLISRRDWLDPEQMAQTRPVSLQARDGQRLHGFLTVPRGSSGKNLPLVVNPHGGPFGKFESWSFETERQLLAAAGYAVLQVDFRGSGNHGRAFRVAGAQEWGGKMQDDVTDATRWAIQQGIADAGRICIYGGSYGAYSALMGAVREPTLYKCAVGNVGVYELPLFYEEDARVRKSQTTYLGEWIGERAAIAAISPTRLADRIRIPVLLAAGEEDEVAPVKHTRLMEKALKAAGVPVESIYFDSEGHGYYLEESRRTYFSRLLGFLDRHIGGGAAPAADAAAK